MSILRNTAASRSTAVKGADPILEESYAGDSVVVRGFGGTVTLISHLLSEQILIQSNPSNCRSTRHAASVLSTLLKANELAGDLVVPNPVVRAKPLISSHATEVEGILTCFLFVQLHTVSQKRWRILTTQNCS